MNRKEFFNRFILSLAGLTFVKYLIPMSESREVILFHPLIAGFHFCDGYKTQHKLRANGQLGLYRQPGNPYDKNAIEVFYGTAKLGYIPRRENKIVARMMDHDIQIKAQVVKVDLRKPSC